MSTVASRELRNHTSEVLRQVAQGARVTITVNGKPVAEIGPVRTARRVSLSKGELITVLSHHQADSALRSELAALAGDTTDDIGPIR